ncbi:hypothetical protein [Vibrio nigripulchritudo]|uniref:hypothetical protein n=1 Tax=Vibrio nigripulchritudo TaxID=28173 RepID=UPI00248FFB06|nr:hypothetical protein [Vibrio nigripulchritudo]BDU41173.1 hypothetical protein TUMSATVNIG2_56420 [Vibrio nigripulchritudo]BDU46938.1 hypothetical protein TUMSATVNIG3_57360 [Vibrio nigripulchritudo]
MSHLLEGWSDGEEGGLKETWVSRVVVHLYERAILMPSVMLISTGCLPSCASGYELRTEN